MSIRHVIMKMLRGLPHRPLDIAREARESRARLAKPMRFSRKRLWEPAYRLMQMWDNFGFINWIYKVSWVDKCEFGERVEFFLLGRVQFFKFKSK